MSRAELPETQPAARAAAARADRGPRQGRLPREGRYLAAGAAVFFTFSLLVALVPGMGAAPPRPGAAQAPQWLIDVELASRYTLAWIALVLVTRALASRIRGDGWWAALQVVGFGTVLAVVVVAYLNAVSCILPWRGCPAVSWAWVAGRAFAVTSWMTPAAALLLARVAAARAVRPLEEEIRVNELLRELSRAQVSTLTMQLRPHFLFNTLQSIATLVHRDTAAAGHMLAGLRELFHRSVNLADRGTVPLAEELAIVQLYTGIQSTRFGDRIAFTIQADGAAREALVPQFLLQPLVENAVHHGVGRAGEGWVRVAARVEPGGRWLVVEVADSGAGSAEGEAENGFGLGVSNTRARLEALYPAMHAFSLQRDAGAGWTARVQLPYRRAGDDA